MPITPSQRPTREWLLLLVTLAAVAALCVPLWNWARPQHAGGDWSTWTPERVGRLLLGPEQIACYAFAGWAGLILLSRAWEVRRQRKAFDLELLPTDEGARILPEDARPTLRKVEQTTARRGPFILANMVRLGLGKYAISRSAPDVAEVVRNQAEVEQGRLVTTMATVQYLAWAIPAIGFLGTVRGLAGSLTMANATDESLPQFMDQATRHLTVAFDCTFIALTLSLLVMYLLHTVQRMEESLVIDCQQFCQEHLLLRLYDPQPEPAEVLS
jgi:MotA/TolQ/ExbB proton channel family